MSNFPKNLTVFKLDAETETPLDADAIAAALAEKPFLPIEGLVRKSVGFAEPSPGEYLYGQGGWHLAVLKTAEKKLPTAAIKQELAEIEKAWVSCGATPFNKKQRDEKREAIIDRILPHILPTHGEVRIYVNLRTGWLWVDQASASKVELALGELRTALGGLKVTRLGAVIGEPGLKQVAYGDGNAAYDEGLMEIGSFVTLVSEEGRISYKGVGLDEDTVHEALAAGYKVSKIGASYDGGAYFFLDDKFVFSGIKLDGVQAGADFGEDFALFTGTLAKVVDEVVKVFGKPQEPDGQEEDF